ncbi:conserved protein, with A weak D-galactarate dehydratase/altronate hydrolase domain [Thermosipho africanus TCF52B]|uniref:Conserved protein, with A weak D-galactarate dehydratase/altronate hydrolase domain n=1 Tax=Thermosipho africanus (strain TCF52B) TaxID=484019 RepID=B7IH00_THEAB|nr:ATP-binding protein [Thermosipho africanus]ACJ75364.1 conserved protein, with A weak D-galactarate dehydratase/altronate hydrolase domain [Thermosipho africanus TCF52B]
MKGLPIGLQDFSDIVNNNMIYVDKTKFIYDLASSGNKYFFVSRPRRFGKSLTLSVFENLFKGNKELFKDTWIYDKWDFSQTFPVVRINLVGLNCESLEKVQLGLYMQISTIAKKFNLSLKFLEKDISYGFKELIQSLSEKLNSRVVVLVDEYEKPVLDNIHKKEKAQRMREFLRNFYSILKEEDSSLRFVFLTGITKFTKMGVFSSLNNLEDISFDDKFSTMFGYTQEELESYFDEYINLYTDKFNVDKQSFLEKLRDFYNGFSFNGVDKVYNPYAVLCFFSKERFSPYWYESGSPNFLFDYIKNKNIEITDIVGKKITESDFTSREIENATIESFLTQTGYLTFKEREILENGDVWYKLDFPNRDVQTSFAKLLAEARYGINQEERYELIKNINESIKNKDPEKLKNVLVQVIQSISYRVYNEKNIPELLYSSWIYLILAMSGFNVSMEEEQILGRPDIVLKYNNEVFIFEVKIDKSPDLAIKQINKKNYFKKFLSNSVYAVGISISSKSRNVSEVLIEKIDEVKM